MRFVFLELCDLLSANQPGQLSPNPSGPQNVGIPESSWGGSNDGTYVPMVLAHLPQRSSTNGLEDYLKSKRSVLIQNNSRNMKLENQHGLKRIENKGYGSPCRRVIFIYHKSSI